MGREVENRTNGGVLIGSAAISRPRFSLGQWVVKKFSLRPKVTVASFFGPGEWIFVAFSGSAGMGQWFESALRPQVIAGSVPFQSTLSHLPSQPKHHATPVVGGGWNDRTRQNSMEWSGRRLYL